MKVFGIEKNLLSSVQVVTELPTDLSPLKQALIKGISGAIGAGISAIALFPVENLKTRQMLE